MADGSIMFEIGADDKEAQKKLNQLRRDIEKTNEALNKHMGEKNAISAELSDAREEAKALNAELEDIRTQRAEAAKDMSANAPGRGRFAAVDPEVYAAAKEQYVALGVEEDKRAASLAEVEKRVEGLEAKEQRVLTKIEQQNAKLEEQQSQAGAVERILAQQSGSVLPQLSARIEDVSKSVKKGVRNILKWGFGIRSAFILFRKLRSAIKEGINTFAEYDEETKNSINGLKNALTGLKVAWGAAFAPIVNAVAPMLQRLISLLATAAEYVQMFFAVLRGENSYKKVIANNEALAKSYGGAGGAAKDAQKQIMGFDEINKLNGENSGGGGGGGGASPIEGVDDALIPPETMEKLTWLKDHLNEILLIAGGIGAALLAWKIASGLSAGLGVVWGNFVKILGIAVAIGGAIVFIKNGIDAWANGVSWENLHGMLAGLLIMVVGLGLAFGKTGAAIGLLVGGIVMLVIGLKDWITTGELSSETFWLLEMAIMAVGFAIMLLTGSWIPAVIAVIAMLVLAVVKNWDKIKATLAKAWAAVKTFFANIWNKIKELAEKIADTFNSVKETLVNKFEQIKTAVTEKVQALRDKVTETIQNIKDAFLNLKLELPHIKMPHISVTWEDVSQSSIARLLGITALPHFGINWYAKGGVVDGATLIGAGEAGKEAIVPLERNTEWIRMVADGMLDALIGNSKFANAIKEIPAIANGQIVPPRAITNGGSVFTDADIDKLVRGITAAFTEESADQSIKLYLDGKQIAETVTKHQRRMERGFA